MKEAKRWDFFKREYTTVQIEDDCKTFSDDMDEEVTCPNCRKKFKFGDGYTSRRWHRAGGMGYIVCSNCYEEEWQLERLADDMKGTT